MGYFSNGIQFTSCILEFGSLIFYHISCFRFTDDVFLVMLLQTGKSKHYGYIEFEYPEVVSFFIVDNVVTIFIVF